MSKLELEKKAKEEANQKLKRIEEERKKREEKAKKEKEEKAKKAKIDKANKEKEEKLKKEKKEKEKKEKEEKEQKEKKEREEREEKLKKEKKELEELLKQEKEKALKEKKEAELRHSKIIQKIKEKAKKEMDMQKKENEKRIKEGIEEYKKQNENKLNIDNINIENEELKMNIDKLNQESKIFKSKLQDIKKQCYEEMNNKYLNIMQEKIKEIHNTILKDVQEQNQQILNSYIKKFEELEQKRESDYNEMSKLMLNNEQQQEGEIVFSMIKTTHHGIKCNKCGENPITGFRYKCSVCQNYNLCEKCEAKNFETKEHIHNFIKMRKTEKIEEIKPKKEIKVKEVIKPKEIKIEEKKEIIPQENNIININKIEENNYNYELINNEKDLTKEVQQFTVKEIEFQIMIKNNSDLPWPANRTKLINDKQNSNIQCQDFILNNLNKDQIQSLTIKLKFNNEDEGMKKCVFNFSVDNKIYGQPIILNVDIKEDPDVKEFRDLFNLSKEDYNSKKLKDALIKFQGDKNKAFDSLFE